jgi:hypothetical protein
MSEHIQPAPAPHPHTGTAATTAEEHERTPGVSHEREEFNFRLVLWVGFGLIVTAIVIHFAVAWLLGGLERYNAQPSGEMSALALEDAQKPLAQRLDNVPQPHLEGIERESSLLEIRTEKGEEKRFYASVDVRVRIGENEKARLFELREGQRVTLAYHMPGGVGGGIGVVTAVMSPPEKADESKPHSELPDAMRTINGEIVRIVPRSIAASREWAEVQREHYGWTDRDKGIVHIPVEKAMTEILKSKEFSTDGKKKKGDGRLSSPSRSSSGRVSVGGKR